MNLPQTPIQPFLLGGSWCETSHGIPISNPFTGALLTKVCQAGKSECEKAIQLAVEAFSTLKNFSSYQRANALQNIARGLTERQEEFARLICLESGKPITDARREVSRGIQTFTVASEETKRIPGEIVPMDLTPGTEHYQGILGRFPIGPVLGITPFNFPLNLVAHKVAPSLAVGNPIVIKPAPQTPLTALLLGEVITNSGFPDGTISIVPCDNALAEHMVCDSRFQAMSFTGSAAVGWMLKPKAAKKRVTLELGGNAGVIIEPDSHIDAVVNKCVTGGFSYSGQTCISIQRIFVQNQVYDQFTNAFVKRVETLSMGDPMQESTVVGPLINEAAGKRVETWIDEAVSLGARILTGGRRQGPMIQPTVLTEVSADMKVSCEEVFGPVVTVTRYQEYEQALQFLNDSPFGLQAGIFTQNINKIFQAYQELQVGTVLANEIPTFRSDHMPYGGVKDSGLGREGVRYAMEELTELKLLVVNLHS